jgi:chemotaxis protein methyltransferase CheR
MGRILMQNIFLQSISDEEYQSLKKLIENLTGIRLNVNRRYFLENFLLKRCQYLEISNFKTYYEVLKKNELEMTLLINLVTNLSTSFFREKHHFEYLKKHILPTLKSLKQKIRIWSAGCSTGEEPYSIAITLSETIENMNKYDIKILATDLNTDALKIAKRGIYDRDQSKTLSEHTKSYCVQENDTIQINDDIKKIITFKKLNLLDPWPMKKMFDIIFCRNVIIYLKPEVIDQLLNKIDQLLEPGGFLFLGHSENLRHFSDRYISLGQTIYKKVT